MQENFRQFLDRLRQEGELVDLRQPVDIRHIATLVDQADTALYFHDVIGYDHAQGGYRPFHLEDELGPDNCIHGEKGCTLDRSLRSDVCNSYFCDMLGEFVKKADKATSVIVMSGEGDISRMSPILWPDRGS